MPTPGNVEPAFSLGIEEEYLLVDLATRDLVSDPPGELLQRCIAETDGRVSPEFLRSQLEVKTSVCASVSSMLKLPGIQSVPAERDVEPPTCAARSTSNTLRPSVARAASSCSSS